MISEFAVNSEDEGGYNADREGAVIASRERLPILPECEVLSRMGIGRGSCRFCRNRGTRDGGRDEVVAVSAGIGISRMGETVVPAVSRV